MDKHLQKKSTRSRQADGSPHPIDVHVGHRMRLRRILLGMSQENLAARLGLTFQQVQKYERGLNRISGSRLYDISQILQVPIDYFFDEFSEDTLTSAPDMSVLSSANSEDELCTELMGREESIILVNSYNKIKNPHLRRLLYDLIESMSTSNSLES